MICDDCIKKEVCKFKEKCNAYEEEYSTPADDVIAIEVKCKHRVTPPMQRVLSCSVATKQG